MQLLGIGLCASDSPFTASVALEEVEGQKAEQDDIDGQVRCAGREAGQGLVPDHPDPPDLETLTSLSARIGVLSSPNACVQTR